MQIVFLNWFFGHSGLCETSNCTQIYVRVFFGQWCQNKSFFGHISRIFFGQGYWRNLAVNPLNLPQGPQPPAAQVTYKQKQNCCLKKTMIIVYKQIDRTKDKQ